MDCKSGRFSILGCIQAEACLGAMEGGAVCETSGTLGITPTLVDSLPDGDHEAPRWQQH